MCLVRFAALQFGLQDRIIILVEQVERSLIFIGGNPCQAIGQFADAVFGSPPLADCASLSRGRNADERPDGSNSIRK